MGGIHDQVEDHLIQFSGQAWYQRKGVIEIGDQVGNVFPFIARNRQGAVDRPVQINRGVVFGSRVRELLHRSHNLGNPVHAFQGLPDCFWNLILEKI